MFWRWCCCFREVDLFEISKDPHDAFVTDRTAFGRIFLIVVVDGVVSGIQGLRLRQELATELKGLFALAG